MRARKVHLHFTIYLLPSQSGWWYAKVRAKSELGQSYIRVTLESSFRMIRVG